MLERIVTVTLNGVPWFCYKSSSYARRYVSIPSIRAMFYVPKEKQGPKNMELNFGLPVEINL